jgi:hypothetical protein
MKEEKRKSGTFTFRKMVNDFRSTVGSFFDKRRGKNSFYTMEDVALAAFSIFFTQSPSFLAYQRSMEKKKGRNNATSLFMVEKIPTDNHIRNLLDEVDPSCVFPVFSRVVEELDSTGRLEMFRSFNNDLFIALDGLQYFSSKTIHCDNCSTKKHKDGSITYSHSAVIPAIVAPGKNRVIPLAPEFITPQDGSKKQDCENAAAKRWVKKYTPLYRDLGIAILGDDLYCKHPFCSLLLEKELNFILVCKPKSHKTLYEWVGELEAMGEVEKVVVRRWTGKAREIDTYRFINHVPLRDGEDALFINWCELTTEGEDGTVIYKNAFATSYEITRDNVMGIVHTGRARWKIENENNNVLKNRGYHLEHNFGHGIKYLSYLLLTFNILAFLFHTLLYIADKKYKLIRDNLPRRKTFFNDIRALTRYLYFRSWDEMLDFMLRGLELDIPDTG